MEFIVYLLTGVIAGTMAGLFGVGGGVIIVPALVFSFALLKLNTMLATHLAIGTSLACMLPTSISSTLGHHKNGGVDWRTLKILTPAIMVGSWCGVATTVSLNGSTLQVILGIGLIITALTVLLKQARAREHANFQPPPWLLATGGTTIGYIAAIFGIGGGIMTIPFLNRLGQTMRLCVGTSAACGLPIAFIGAAANIYLGSPLTGQLKYSTGLVYWPAFAGVVTMSVPCARLGARLAQKLPADNLKTLFACMLLLVGAKFVFLS